MRSAQFVKGKIWDEEKQASYEQTFETPGIETFLPYEKYAKLRTQQYVTVQPKQKYYRAERILTLIEVKEADHVDNAGRGGLVVHGFLVDITPPMRFDGFPIRLDDDKFLEELLDEKWHLKMPPFPILKRPLEIPQVEWEVHP